MMEIEEAKERLLAFKKKLPEDLQEEFDTVLFLMNRVSVIMTLESIQALVDLKEEEEKEEEND